MDILFINILLYSITSFYFYNKDKIFSLRVIVFILFTIFSCASYYITQTNIYFLYSNTSFKEDDISLLPYILNYFAILFITKSFNNIENIKFQDSAKITNILRNKYISYIEFFTIILSFVYIILQYQWYLLFSHIELGDIYNKAHEGEGLVFPSQILNIIYFRSNQVLTFLTPLLYTIEFCKIILFSKKKKAIIILLLTYIPQVIGCVISANRGGMVFSTASIFFFIIYFWPYLQSRTQNIIRGISIIGGAIFISYFLTITVSRKEGDIERSNITIWGYFGESFPNLGQEIWGKPKQFIGGERKFPTIYSFLTGEKKVEIKGGSAGAHEYYELYTGVPILCFKTFYGDLYVEFGPIVPFLLILLFIRIITYMRKKLHDSIFSLPIIHFAYMMLIWGLFNANKFSESDFMILILQYLLLYQLNKKSFTKKYV